VTAFDRNELTWRKSVYSAQGNCVEIARTEQSVYMRDSKDPDGPVLTFSVEVFRSFIETLKH